MTDPWSPPSLMNQLLTHINKQEPIPSDKNWYLSDIMSKDKTLGLSKIEEFLEHFAMIIDKYPTPENAKTNYMLVRLVTNFFI